MAKVAIPPVKLPWREQDIKSGDPELLANYLKVLVKTLQKKIEEIGNVVNVNADKLNSNGGGGGGGGDMYKADYDPDHDKKVEKADHADRAGYANNSGKLNNHPDTDFMLKADYDSDGDGKVDNAENADNAQTLQGKEPSDFATSDHSHALDELNNVNISNPNDKQVLIYDGNNNVWINGDVSGGGGNGNVLVDVTDQCRIEWISKPIPCYPYIRYTAPSGSFQVGETVKGLTSGATGKVFSTSSYAVRLYLTNVSGTFQNQEQIKGLTSGATAKVYYYTGQRNYPDNITHGSENSILTEDLNDYLEWESTANGHLVRVAWLKVYVPEQEGLYIVSPVMGTGSMIDDKISYRYVKTFTAISPINCDQGYQNLFASPWRFNGVLGFREGLPAGYFLNTKDLGETNGGWGYFAFYFEQRDTATLRWRIHRIKVYKVLEGENGGGSSTLAGLSDTDINNPQNNQGLLFSNGKWINSDNIMLKTNYDSDGDGKVDNAENADNAQTLQGKEPSDFADANHTHSVEDLSNVNISSPTDAQVIAYNETNSEWVNKTIPDGDMKKSVYDPDDDGKVENADNADKLENHPASYFATADHNHNLSDLADVDDTDKADGKILQWSASANAHIYVDKGNDDSEKYYITPEDYGASGDGISDDSAAFQNMFDDIMNKYAIIILGAKQYKLTQKLDIHVNKGLKILGSGLQVTKIFFPSLSGGNWGFNIIYGDDELACLTLQGFSFLTNMTDMNKGAILAEWPLENRPYIPDVNVYQQSPYWKLVVNQVQIAGEASADNGWGYGLYIKGLNNTSISNYIFWGKKHSEGDDLVPDSHHAICYDTHADNAAATGHYLAKSFIFFADNAVYCNQHIEGLHIDKSEFVAINYGVNLNLTNNWPVFTLYNCHINARIVGFNANKGASIHIVGNNIASREGCSQQFIGAQLMGSLYCRIEGNHFTKNSSGNWGGIVVGNDTNHYHIGTNIFQAGAVSGTTNVGIWLQNTAGNNAIIEPENKHIWDGSFVYKILDQR